MKINQSTATFSTIVGIGEKIKKIAKETGEEYIQLNRGVNAVVDIDLTPIIDTIDFNSKSVQIYAPNSGTEGLKQAINEEYFDNQCDTTNISITPGGMPALDLVFQLLDVDKFYFPQFYWGSYAKVATIRKVTIATYYDFNTEIDANSAILICDPNNPTGVKLDDSYLYAEIVKLTKKGVIVIFDSPYRNIFTKDDLFLKLAQLENVIITESFSKSLGISGLRIGFIHSSDKNFNTELNIRLLYEFNGVNTLAQIIVEKLLSTNVGKTAVTNFKNETKKHIQLNIDYLIANNLLTAQIYQHAQPLGIFAIINKSEDALFANKIGSVGLAKFTHNQVDKEKFKNDSRICVSVQHDQFVKYMNAFIVNTCKHVRSMAGGCKVCGDPSF